MPPLLDVFVLTNNEEELLPYCLESYCLIADLIGVCSVVDNNSTDATLDIIQSYRGRLPIVLQRHNHNSHHGEMRSKALQPCRSPYIMYLDADESWTSDMRDWLLEERYKPWGLIGFMKYTTWADRYHYVTGGNGHTWRMFRNEPGVHFPESVHTVPNSPRGFGSAVFTHEWYDPLLYDHTACKSREALWAKGMRYQIWAEQNVPAVGGPGEYIWRVDNTKPEQIEEFPEHVKRRIFCGP
jgi:glycosyltransferase involved in cell wall biosynthesis